MLVLPEKTEPLWKSCLSHASFKVFFFVQCFSFFSSSLFFSVLISTATLAWGVNLPAHLVIVKGGEYYDAKSHRYVDYAITDILQMMGRAGRPQFDDSGEAVIMCKKARFKKKTNLNFFLKARLR